jgi:hypothetical protein
LHYGIDDAGNDGKLVHGPRLKVDSIPQPA